jgi:hypothetical protein
MIKTTDNLQLISENIEKLINKVLDNDKVIASQLTELQIAHIRYETDVQMGILIINGKMEVILYTVTALNILGWTVSHLPTSEDTKTPPMLNADGSPLTIEMWPGYIAMTTGHPVENVPVQIYNMLEQSFSWVLVSAYPCTTCTQEANDTWITVSIRKLYELGRV